MKSSLVNMIVSLGGISLAVGGLLGIVHAVTEKPIAESAQKAKIEAIADILPSFEGNPLDGAVEVTPEGESVPLWVYPAYNSNGDFIGAAVQSYTMDGFSGEISVMVGLDTSGKITGYSILKHAETPGLGAKAGTWFKDPVGNRSIIGSDSPLAVSKDGGEIDAITAATITSRAFLQAVNRARKAFDLYVVSK